MKTLLMTGARGSVAQFLREQFRGRYRLRLSDLEDPDDLGPDEISMPADLCDLAAVRRVVEGVDGIVHLGGYSVEGSWEVIRNANIEGTYNLYESARDAGVKRVIFASSNHAMGFYPRSETVDDRRYPKPDSRYGVSKVFGEALASLYADKYGVETLCIRIGNVWTKPLDYRRLSIWISPRDLAQLVEIGLEHPEIRFEIVYGMSDNQRAWWDNSNARRLGYQPQDLSEDYAAEVIASGPTSMGDAAADKYQGGTFVSVESGSVMPSSRI